MSRHDAGSVREESTTDMARMEEHVKSILRHVEPSNNKTDAVNKVVDFKLSFGGLTINVDELVIRLKSGGQNGAKSIRSNHNCWLAIRP